VDGSITKSMHGELNRYFITFYAYEMLIRLFSSRHNKQYNNSVVILSKSSQAENSVSRLYQNSDY